MADGSGCIHSRAVADPPLCHARSTCRGEALRERKPALYSTHAPRQTEAERRDRSCQERRRFVIFESASAALRVPSSRPPHHSRRIRVAASEFAHRLGRDAAGPERPTAHSPAERIRSHVFSPPHAAARPAVLQAASQTCTDPHGRARRMVWPSSMRHRGRALKLHSCSERARGRRAGSVGRAPWCAAC